MRAGPRRAALLAAAVAGLAGCGGGRSGQASLSLSQLPLVPGARAVATATQCDKGANAFCALELLVVDRSFSSSGALVTREHQMLRRSGWSQATGDTGDEQAAYSRDRRLQVVYATALGDLTGVDLKWIKRPRSFAIALSRAVFSRRPAMSLILERGPE
jgi:hypothetical protein